MHAHVRHKWSQRADERDRGGLHLAEPRIAPRFDPTDWWRCDRVRPALTLCGEVGEPILWGGLRDRPPQRDVLLQGIELCRRRDLRRFASAWAIRTPGTAAYDLGKCRGLGKGSG
eukprot:6578597-Prymnesium_polylepis.3